MRLPQGYGSSSSRGLAPESPSPRNRSGRQWWPEPGASQRGRARSGSKSETDETRIRNVQV